MRKRLCLLAVTLLCAGLPASAQVPLPIVRLTLVAAVEQPVGMAVRAGDPDLYLVEKTGRVRAVRGGLLDPTPALDIRSSVSHGFEQGLLGLAFSPDGSKMYVDYTDAAGDTRIHEFAMSGGVAVPATRREVLFVDQPFDNHNGGQLAFGPDGFLYVALGDGGSGGDPFNNGQRLDTLLGKILRIDPLGAVPYAIPASNPFVGISGADEIWAYGLRNPWRFSFDRDTGDLWIGDVGQNMWEEVDLQPASSPGGENYGWRRMEGNHTYSGSEPGNHTRPIHEYAHVGGACSITGGYVYRGTRIPLLGGAYVFGDFCDGRLRFLERVGPLVVPLELGVQVPSLTSFGEDQAGELYAMSLGGAVYRLDPLVV